MSHVLQAQQVVDGVYWVGAIDWAIRNFHGYATSRGTTYNAFLVMAEKVTLVDTVKAPFHDEMLSRIASVVDPEKIDVIISNHSEMDHSGCLPRIVEQVKPAEIYASTAGQKALAEHFRPSFEITAVKEGDVVDLGGKTVQFMETKMCHWPDSMVSYLAEDKLLFSQDAFGMHLASYERYADELPAWLTEHEAGKYYANILLPLSRFVAKTLEKIQASGLEFRIVAPDHGPMHRTPEDIARVLGWYERWAAQKRTNKAIVVYDTMWQSTPKMASAVGDGLAAGGAKVKLMPLSGCHRSDVATELLDAGALVVGAPTINNTMYPTLADALTYVRGLKPAGLIGGVFGSYGWSGESTRDLAAELERMNVEIIGEPAKAKYVPSGDDLEPCYQLGLRIAEALAQRAT